MSQAFDKLLQLIELLRPKFYNRLTWLIVVSGLTIMSTPFWERLLESILEQTLQIQITGESDVKWGFSLIVIGLLYHFVTTSLHEYVRSRGIVNSVDNLRILQIKCNSTRDGNKQLAQFRLHNSGRRPISVDTWFVAWDNYAVKSGELYNSKNIFPIVLHEEERIDFLVDISHRPVEALNVMGVSDSRNHLWEVTSESLDRFKTTAIQYKD